MASSIAGSRMSFSSRSVSRPTSRAISMTVCFRHLISRAHQRVVERDVLALLPRRERRAGGEFRAGPEDREFLVDHAKTGIGLFELDDRRRDRAAVGAVVVEEFHERDIARRIAADRRRRIVQDLLAAFGNGPLEDFRFGSALSLLQNPQRFHDDFRVLQEILANPLLERVELSRFAGHRRRVLSVRLVNTERSHQRNSGHGQQTESATCCDASFPWRSSGFNRRGHGYSTA